MITIEKLDDISNDIIETIEDRFLSTLYDVDQDLMTKDDVKEVLRHAIQCGKSFKLGLIKGYQKREENKL